MSLSTWYTDLDLPIYLMNRFLSTWYTDLDLPIYLMNRYVSTYLPDIQILIYQSTWWIGLYLSIYLMNRSLPRSITSFIQWSNGAKRSFLCLLSFITSIFIILKKSVFLSPILIITIFLISGPNYIVPILIIFLS